MVNETRIVGQPIDTRLPRVTPASTERITRHMVSARTIWCPGCSNGIVARAIIDAVLALGLDLTKVVVVAGIGCCGRIVQYVDFSTVHTPHGRALALATGAKIFDPDLHIIVVMGDGDCTAIGGNHLIHAARRNVDLTAVVFNNAIYGMTGGQMSPTTYKGDRSTTSSYGNVEQAFDVCELAAAAGATYVARGTAYAYGQLTRLVAGGIVHKGFALVEAIVTCPTYYGRQNESGDPAAMLLRQRDSAVPRDRYEATGGREQERYPVGVLRHVEREEYTTAYEEVIRRAQAG